VIDWPVPYGEMEHYYAVADRIEGLRLVIFEGAGHMAPLEEPQQVSAALGAWLAG